MISNFIKNHRKLLIVFLLALIVRGVLLYFVYDDNYFLPLRAYSDEIAKNIAKGNGFAADLKADYHELPGYPFLTALTYIIFGQIGNNIYLQVFQVILSSVSVFLIYAIAKKFFDEKVSLLAAFFWVIWLPEARLAVLPMHDYPVIFLVLAGFYFFIRGVFEEKNIFFYLFAFIIGLASLFRSDPLLLPLFTGFFLWIYSGNWKHALKITSLSAIIIFSILLPWGLRNYLVFNRFEFTRTVLWQSVWEGFGEFPNSFGAILSDDVTYDQVKQEYPDVQYGSPRYQEILKEKSITVLKSNPGWYAMMLPKRFLMMLFAPRNFAASFMMNPDMNRQKFFETYPGNSNFDYLVWLFRKSPVQFFLKAGILVGIQILVLTLSVIGFWFYRKDWRKYLILVSPWFYFYFSHLPIYWEARYLVPGEFPYLILSAAALVFMWNLSKDKIIKKI